MKLNNNIPDDAYINRVMLDEIKASTAQIQHSLTTLDNATTSRFGHKSLPFTNINDPRLNKVLSISWYGPVDQVLEKIAQAVGYKVQYFGQTPSFPVIVIIGKLNAPEQRTALALLQDITVQAQRQANISINEEARVISVRYI
ncbi:DotD/TraH family lipoprotein [Facilibium subflavum]|uniref:DotD/TraH family lipoprotein n=1 Tax=Facilibium subflavum TaxID=2219058 RepID=UPI0013C33DC6|nr:DotD/TraH family lipoprotein [Facilibium subflavum]